MYPHSIPTHKFWLNTFVTEVTSCRQTRRTLKYGSSFWVMPFGSIGLLERFREYLFRLLLWNVKCYLDRLQERFVVLRIADQVWLFMAICWFCKRNTEHNVFSLAYLWGLLRQFLTWWKRCSWCWLGIVSVGVGVMVVVVGRCFCCRYLLFLLYLFTCHEYISVNGLWS